MKRYGIAGVACVLFVTFLLKASAQDAAKTETTNASPDVIAAMAQFKPIAQSVLDRITKGDISAAKTNITKLESAWDKKETELKAKYPSEWKLIDDAIDNALDIVRKPAAPELEKSKAALKDVISKLKNPVAPAKDADKTPK